jgi:hypothetical protein
MCQLCFPLKMIINRRSVPSPMIVTAMVAHFVSFVDVRMWMVLTPTTSAFFELIEK